MTGCTFLVSSGVCIVTSCTFRPQRCRTVHETQNPSPYSSNVKKSWSFTSMPPLRPRVLHMVNFTLSSWNEVEPGSSVGIVTTLRPELSGIRISAGAGRTSRPQNVQTASETHPASCLLDKADGTWIWPLPSFRMSGSVPLLFALSSCRSQGQLRLMILPRLRRAFMSRLSRF